jgi:hypothetical protein
MRGSIGAIPMPGSMGAIEVKEAEDCIIAETQRQRHRTETPGSAQLQLGQGRRESREEKSDVSTAEDSESNQRELAAAELGVQRQQKRNEE